MVRVVDCCYEATGRPGFICDFSPPRSGNIAEVKRADIPADFISIAYNPGRVVRANSAMLATAIQPRDGQGDGLHPRHSRHEPAGYPVVAAGRADAGAGKRSGGSRRPVQQQGPGAAGSERIPAHRTDCCDSRHERGHWTSGSQAFENQRLSASARLSTWAEVSRKKRSWWYGRWTPEPTFFCRSPFSTPKTPTASVTVTSGTRVRRFRFRYFTGCKSWNRAGVLFSSVPDGVRAELEGGTLRAWRLRWNCMAGSERRG